MGLIRRLLCKVRNETCIETLKKRGLKMGTNCYVDCKCQIDSSHCWLIEIGNDVTLTSDCIILAHDASTKRDLGYAKIGRVIIEDKVFVGVNSVILPNTHIGANTIIGASSVVIGEVESDSVYCGAPAKKVCSKQDFLDKHKKQIDTNPTYDKNWTISKNITKKMKEKMKDDINNKIGYVE